LISKGYKNASTDAATIRSWWNGHPNAMIGMPTGEAVGAWVLDIDDPAVFEAHCEIAIPVTRKTLTGKGYHLWFAEDPEHEVRNAQVKKKDGEKVWPFPDLPGAEVRGNGGYVIVPPSLHPSGRRYTWAVDGDPVPPPERLLAIVRKESAPPKEAGASRPAPGAAQAPAQPAGREGDTAWGLAALEGECANIRAAGNGEQEGTLNDAALKIGAIVAGKNLTVETAKAKLIAAGLSMPSYNSRDAWTVEGIVAKIERGLNDGARNPRVPEQRGPRGFMDRAPPPQDDDASYDPETGEVIDEEIIEDDEPPQQPRPRRGIKLEDFYAYMPAHNYLFGPSGEAWPGASVNSRFPQIPLLDTKGNPVLDKKGEPVMLNPNQWLDKNRPVEQMTWAPGEPQVIAHRLISDGGWMPRPNCHVFNLYRPPLRFDGDARQVAPWLDHIRRIYPEDADHLVHWLAHRVQRPQEKINHAIVLGGDQGIGKDTFLEPVKQGVGPWNFQEVSPATILGRFNGYLKSVILRVSEARDLGDFDRFGFYDHMKTYTAAPPDVLRVDEKFRNEYSIFNVCGVIITTNHKTDGIYLPADDRRHYVAWSNCTKDDFDDAYWSELWGWYEAGGIGHVVSYLQSLPLDDFNAKAPPPKTPAFWEIVSSNQAPEDAELSDALEDLNLGNKKWAVTIEMVANAAFDAGAIDFSAWLKDRKNSRAVRHKLDKAGWVATRNPDRQDGLWRVNGRRCAVYARRELSIRDAVQAAANLAERQ
jgi:hypothetical protein